MHGPETVGRNDGASSFEDHADVTIFGPAELDEPDVVGEIRSAEDMLDELLEDIDLPEGMELPEGLGRSDD